MKKSTTKTGSRYNSIFWKFFLWGAGAFLLFLILINMGLFGGMPSLAQLEKEKRESGALLPPESVVL